VTAQREGGAPAGARQAGCEQRVAQLAQARGGGTAAQRGDLVGGGGVRAVPGRGGVGDAPEAPLDRGGVARLEREQQLDGARGVRGAHVPPCRRVVARDEPARDGLRLGVAVACVASRGCGGGGVEAGGARRGGREERHQQGSRHHS
jgi:hypothetical protein